MAILKDDLRQLASRYKSDPESVYNTWFIESQARLKAFRAIRRGVTEVVKTIREGGFGNDFKGSSLETVLKSITEQKQVFEGAAHPFYWKPKLRIPDIYEDEDNKRAFGQFLEKCLGNLSSDRVIREILWLDAHHIKGLGPAVANILYFLSPTMFPPFNTAMVRGYNALFGDSKKLGSWTTYLSMRDVIIKANSELQPALSTDLGAFSGLLYEIGVGKIIIDSTSTAVLAMERERVEKVGRQRHLEVQRDHQEQNEHFKVQYLLAKIGNSLGYDVHVASNDRSKVYDGQSLSFMTLAAIPDMELPKDIRQTLSLIDVLWLSAGGREIVSAFEIEKSTSIYSGMLRLIDLACSLDSQPVQLLLVAPDAREKEIQAQLHRPAFRQLGSFQMRYILFSDLCEHCAGLCKFGEDHRVMLRIARGKAG
ncbi:MAG: hypothetical protein Q7O66_05045 [Dehalococcoidia bacterium]|nr:hypothetical protein [Dehalococcoidia bacterium]